MTSKELLTSIKSTEMTIWLSLTLLKIQEFCKLEIEVLREDEFRSKWDILLWISSLHQIWTTKTHSCNQTEWWSMTQVQDYHLEVTPIFGLCTQTSMILIMHRMTTLISKAQNKSGWINRTQPVTFNLESWCLIMIIKWTSLLLVALILKRILTLIRERTFRLKKCGIMITVTWSTRIKTRLSEVLRMWLFLLRHSLRTRCCQTCLQMRDFQDINLSKMNKLRINNQLLLLFLNKQIQRPQLDKVSLCKIWLTINLLQMLI